MNNDKDSAVSAQSPKHRKGRSREVSSRFLSPTSTTTTPSEAELLSPRDGLSPSRRKTGSNSTDNRKHRSLEDSGFTTTRGQLWPSSSSSLTSKTNPNATLADHLGNDRFRDFLDRKTRRNDKSGNPTTSVSSLTKQKSCTVFSRFENNDQSDQNNSSKENNVSAVVGGSTTYNTGRIGLLGKSSFSSAKSNSTDFLMMPGRRSMDENTLYKKSLFSKLDSDSTTLDSDSEYSDIRSGTDGRNVWSSKKLGRNRRGISDSNIDIHNTRSSEDSSMLKKFTIKNAIKRANSLTGYKSSKSQWALSPGRSDSPPMSVESKEQLISFSSLKPPTSPSKAKGVDKFLNMGFDFFKTKKSSINLTPPMGLGISEVVHQLRMLNNRLLQWRYVNARSEVVNTSISNPAESNLFYAWNGITKLQRSVMQKKIQYEKEKLEMKLDFIVHSQIKLLEAWGDLERQHVSALTVIKDCLHGVVCKVPLIEGAEVNISTTSVALKQASDLTTSMKSMLTNFPPPQVDKIASLLSELAEVVSQEKLLLEEFYDLFQTISFLELQERSVTSGLIQLQCRQQQLISVDTY